jgi:hypothetical protein
MRGGLALDRAARYTSADFPTSGAEGRPTMRAGRADGPSVFGDLAIPLQHQTFPRKANLSY